METLIRLEEVTKIYGTVLGVNDVTLNLPPGGYGLLGPNGAGKSTLLNLLIGQLSPTRGSVSVMGENPRGNSWLMKHIGFCPAYEGMYARVSGLDWITYLLRLQGHPRKAARERAAECLEMVQMQHAMEKWISKYSRGMRQRTKLAQAIAHDPQFLILDEPLSGLDPVGRSTVTSFLKNWVDGGRSMLIASHVLHEVEAVTRSFLLISDGRLLASGTASEVHQMLLQVPMEIQIWCSDPRRLAASIVTDTHTHTVSITGSGAENPLTVSTANAAQLASGLNTWIPEAGITLHRLATSDDSLQSLFSALMKIHRGEM